MRLVLVSTGKLDLPDTPNWTLALVSQSALSRLGRSSRPKQSATHVRLVRFSWSESDRSCSPHPKPFLHKQ